MISDKRQSNFNPIILLSPLLLVRFGVTVLYRYVRLLTETFLIIYSIGWVSDKSISGQSQGYSALVQQQVGLY